MYLGFGSRPSIKTPSGRRGSKQLPQHLGFSEVPPAPCPVDIRLLEGLIKATPERCFSRRCVELDQHLGVETRIQNPLQLMSTKCGFLGRQRLRFEATESLGVTVPISSHSPFLRFASSRIVHICSTLCAVSYFFKPVSPNRLLVKLFVFLPIRLLFPAQSG